MKKQLSILMASAMTLAVSAPVFADTAPELSVMYNAGTLQGVTPVIENDRAMLPFRALLETIGSTVEYDEATRTVGAKKDGIAITFPLDAQTISITKADGTASSVTSDVSNIIIDDHVYVPVRFMAEAFEMNVGWDASNRTAIVVDTAQYLAEIAEKATNFYRYMELSKPNPEAYSTTSALQFDFHMNGSGADVLKLSLDGTTALDVQGSKALADLTFSTGGNLLSALTGVATMDELKDATLTVLYQDGTFYFKTNLIELLKEKNPNNEEIKAIANLVTSKTWCKAELSSFLEALGLPQETTELLKNTVRNTDTTAMFEELLASIFQQEITATSDAMIIQSMVDAYKHLLSDEYITLTRTGENTYDLEMKLDTDSLLALLGEEADLYDDLIEPLVFDVNVKSTLVDGIATASFGEINFSMTTDPDPMYGEEKLSLQMKLDSALTIGSDKTIEAPTTAIDLMNVFKMLEQ